MTQQDMHVAIADLHRKIRRGQAIQIGFLVALTTLVCWWRFADTPRNLQLGQIEMIDADGRVGARISASAIEFLGSEDGKQERARSELGPRGLGVEVTRNGGTRAVLKANTHEIDLIDYRRNQRGVLTASRIGLQNGILSDAQPRIGWVALRNAGLEVQDAVGRVRAKIGALGRDNANRWEDDPAAGVAIFDENGAITWSAP